VLHRLYYYGNMNGINNKYKTYDEFLNKAMPKITNNKTIPKNEITYDKIMAKVKDTLDLFAGE
jgi:hypothetical protein